MEEIKKGDFVETSKDDINMVYDIDPKTNEVMYYNVYGSLLRFPMAHCTKVEAENEPDYSLDEKVKIRYYDGVGPIYAEARIIGVMMEKNKFVYLYEEVEGDEEDGCGVGTATASRIRAIE